MEPNPIPTPEPTNPNPGALPIEVDPGGLNAKPEVDFQNVPETPAEPGPDGVPDPAKEIPEPGPDTEPGTQ